MMEGHPEDDNIEGLYSAASRCDENRIANTAFHSVSRSTPSVRSSSFPTHFPTMPTHQTITNPVPSSMPTSGMPAPMDVDQMWWGLYPGLLSLWQNGTSP